VKWNVEENINHEWNRIATCVKNTAKVISGESRSSMPEYKEK